MSYYTCTTCGSSLDAGEHCSCGARDKPVQKAHGANRDAADAMLYAIAAKDGHEKDGYRAGMVIYDEVHAMPPNILVMRRECHEAMHKQNRKEIFNRLCSRISQ